MEAPTGTPRPCLHTTQDPHAAAIPEADRQIFEIAAGTGLSVPSLRKQASMAGVAPTLDNCLTRATFAHFQAALSDYVFSALDIVLPAAGPFDWAPGQPIPWSPEQDRCFMDILRAVVRMSAGVKATAAVDNDGAGGEPTRPTAARMWYNLTEQYGFTRAQGSAIALEMVQTAFFDPARGAETFNQDFGDVFLAAAHAVQGDANATHLLFREMLLRSPSDILQVELANATWGAKGDNDIRGYINDVAWRLSDMQARGVAPFARRPQGAALAAARRTSGSTGQRPDPRPVPKASPPNPVGPTPNPTAGTTKAAKAGGDTRKKPPVDTVTEERFCQLEKALESIQSHMALLSSAVLKQDKKQSRAPPELFCFRCGESGHTVSSCTGKPRDDWRNTVPEDHRGKIPQWMAIRERQSESVDKTFARDLDCDTDSCSAQANALTDDPVTATPNVDIDDVITPVTVSPDVLAAPPLTVEALVDSGSSTALVDTPDVLHDAEVLRDVTPYATASGVPLRPTHRGTLVLRALATDGEPLTVRIEGAEAAASIPFWLLGRAPLARAGLALAAEPATSPEVYLEETVTGRRVQLRSSEDGLLRLDAVVLPAPAPAEGLARDVDVTSVRPVALPAVHLAPARDTAEAEGVGVPAALLHHRACHHGVGRLRDLAQAVEGVQLQAATSEPGRSPCPACSLGKSRVADIPRGPHAPRSTGPHQHVHVDLLGTKQASLGGHRMALIAVDDYSRKPYVVLLRDARAESLRQAVRELHTTLRLEHADRCAVLGTPGLPFGAVELHADSQFENEVLRGTYADLGIALHLVPPHEHAALGVAERMIQTLWRATTTTLKATRLPFVFWAHALMQTAFVVARFPRQGMDVTPHEVATGSRASLEGIRSFGCLAWTHEAFVDRPVAKGRGADLASPAIYLGVAANSTRATSGLSVFYSLTTGRVVRRRSFRVDETVYPSPRENIPVLMRALRARHLGLDPSHEAVLPGQGPPADCFTTVVYDRPEEQQPAGVEGVMGPGQETIRRHAPGRGTPAEPMARNRGTFAELDSWSDDEDNENDDDGAGLEGQALEQADPALEGQYCEHDAQNVRQAAHEGGALEGQHGEAGLEDAQPADHEGGALEGQHGEADLEDAQAAAHEGDALEGQHGEADLEDAQAAAHEGDALEGQHGEADLEEAQAVPEGRPVRNRQPPERLQMTHPPTNGKAYESSRDVIATVTQVVAAITQVAQEHGSVGQALRKISEPATPTAEGTAPGKLVRRKDVVHLQAGKEVFAHEKSMMDWDLEGMTDEAFEEEMEIGRVQAPRVYDDKPLTDPVRVPSHESQVKHLSAREQQLWTQSTRNEIDGIIRKHSFERNADGTIRVYSINKAKRLGDVIGMQLVYAKKSDNSLKTRAVARGDQEYRNQDLIGDPSSPTVTYPLVLMQMTVGLTLGWHFATLDSPQAYLNSELTGRYVFVRAPKVLDLGPDAALRLVRAVYGLSDSGARWFLTFSRALTAFGLTQSRLHPCVFFNLERGLLVTIFVDDGPTMYRSEADMRALRRHLKATGIDTTIERTTGHVLGMAFHHDEEERTLALDFEAKERDLLEKFGMEDCEAADLPIGPEDELPFLQEEQTHPRYRELVGSLLHLCKLRWELNNVVRQLAKHAARNGSVHWSVAMRVLRYIKGTLGKKTVLRGAPSLDQMELVGWSDAAFLADRQTLRGVSGYVISLGPTVFVARSVTQKLVTKSSTEAEVVALAEMTGEVMYYEAILREMGVLRDDPVKLICDSQAAIAQMRRPMVSGRSKHVDMRRVRVRWLLDERAVELHWVRTGDQLADSQTKNLRIEEFEKFAAGLHNENGDFQEVVRTTQSNLLEEGCWLGARVSG